MNKITSRALALMLCISTLVSMTSCYEDDDPTVDPTPSSITLKCVKPDYLKAGDKVAEGVLVGGNICTYAPNLGTQADATAGKDLILFIEEVEESMHNIDRQFQILQMNGVLDRCKGVILGEFTDCGTEFTYESVEAMLHEYLVAYHIPVLCGYPGGHGDVNLPLVMGAPVTIDVRNDGATLTFNIEGSPQVINTADITAPVTSLASRLVLAGKREAE